MNGIYLIVDEMMQRCNTFTIHSLIVISFINFHLAAIVFLVIFIFELSAFITFFFLI